MNLTPIDEVTTAGQAMDLAVEWSHLEQDDLFELQEGQSYFEQLAEKFPELREEFEENAIISSRPTCPRHGGPWGSDETCPLCTDEDGNPRPSRE